MANNRTINERFGEFSADLDRAVNDARARLDKAADVARSEYQAGISQSNADDHEARAGSA